MVIERGRHVGVSPVCGDRRFFFTEFRQQFFIKTGNPLTARFMFKLLKVVIIFIIGVYLISTLFMKSQIIEDTNFGTIHQQDVNTVEIEKVCVDSDSKTRSQTCYSVVDILHQDSPHSVHRAVFINGFESEYDTVVQLIPPPGRNSVDSDTRMWRVNHTHLSTQYVAAMLTQIFAVSALRLSEEKDSDSSLLVIGLGGGNFDMFLHKKRPKISITVVEIEPIVIDLAKKWFGVEDDQKRKTIAMDGVEAIRIAEIEGTKYDAVVLDACDTTKSMPCPAKVFLLQKTLRSIKAVLKPMGVFVINVLMLEDRETNEELVEKSLLNQFPICMKMQMSEEANVVFSCLPYSIEQDSLPDSMELIKSRLKESAEKFGIDSALHYSDLMFID
ncbi:hypothetical protein FO519_008548 [Halicephalobus sp. NKZ332]|nr:hypothetical protein FO519_008548 [Halicephalobus sp. NKZ332]